MPNALIENRMENPPLYIAFLVCMCSALGYILIAKRDFDFFSIAILSAVFYFYPAILGYSYNPQFNLPDPLTPWHYGIIISFYIFFLIGAVIGVAANIWAEMYALGGITLVYIFMLSTLGLCFYMSIKFKYASRNILELIIPIGVVIFFYIQRNDITYTLGFIRNIFLLWLFIQVGAVVLVKLSLMK